MWFQSVLTAIPVDSNKGATPPSLSCSLLTSFSPSLLLLSSLYQNILLHDKSEPTSTLLQNYACKVSKVWGEPWGFIKKTINERRKCFYKINWFWFGSPQDASSTRGWTPHPSLAKQASFAQESSLGIIFANSSDKSNANGRADRDPMERTEATEAMEARWQGHPLQLALAEESAKT